ncbi:MAG: hypothetical protein RI101_06080 [Nitrospira sp.]|jgi:hypothetical protein|nr:hypothetical protein [Nitrospira sp.]
MPKRILVLLILVLAQFGCSVSEETGPYTPIALTQKQRESLERLKREHLQIEDLMIGNGPLAALGRKVTADIEVRYASGDGKPIYRGPAIDYFEMEGSVLIHNNVDESGILSLEQQGISLGLNGMAVGGKRRITIAPSLACFDGTVKESTSQGATPSIVCRLVMLYLKDGGIIQVRKETLIVEATLTDSCIPVFMKIPFIYKGQLRCRNADGPLRDPSAPIWRIY